MRSKLGSPSLVEATSRLPLSVPPGGLDSNDGPGTSRSLRAAVPGDDHPGPVTKGRGATGPGPGRHTEGFHPTGNGSLMATSNSHTARHRW